MQILWLSTWLSGKESTCQAGDSGLIPGSGRSPGEGNGNTLQYSCLGSPMDRGAWRATVHGGHKESDTDEQLNAHTHANTIFSSLTNLDYTLIF